MCTSILNSGLNLLCTHLMEFLFAQHCQHLCAEFFFFFCYGPGVLVHQVQNGSMAVVQICGYRNWCTIYKQHAVQFKTRQLSPFACFGPRQFIAFGLMRPKQTWMLLHECNKKQGVGYNSFSIPRKSHGQVTLLYYLIATTWLGRTRECWLPGVRNT